MAKFAISDEDKQQVWHYFNEAVSASAAFSVITAYMLKSWVPILSSALTLTYYRKLYADALAKTPTINPTPILSIPETKGEWIPLTEDYLKYIRDGIR